MDGGGGGHWLIHEFLARDTIELATAGDEWESALGILGEANSQARRCRRKNPAVAHDKGVAEDLAVKRAVRSNEFQDAGVGGGEAAVDILHARASGARCMRGNLAATAFQHRGHFHELLQPASERSVRLANVKTVSLGEIAPF